MPWWCKALFAVASAPLLLALVIAAWVLATDDGKWLDDI